MLFLLLPRPEVEYRLQSSRLTGSSHLGIHLPLLLVMPAGWRGCRQLSQSRTQDCCYFLRPETIYSVNSNCMAKYGSLTPCSTCNNQGLEWNSNFLIPVFKSSAIASFFFTPANSRIASFFINVNANLLGQKRRINKPESTIFLNYISIMNIYPIIYYPDSRVWLWTKAGYKAAHLV